MATKKRMPKKETVRERTERTSNQQPKKRRLRSAAGTASRPVKKVWEGATKEYHVLPQKESGLLGFFTRSRSLFPTYVVNSWKELRQVSWPGRKTTWKLVLAVYLFAVVFGVTIALVDYGLEKLFKEILL